MNQPTILVTGATGNIGRPLIDGLLAEGALVRALTRDPAAAGLPPQVEVTGSDYAGPGVFADAVRGADAVFVNIGAIRAGLGDLLAAARGAGVSKIVLLSSTTVRDQGEQEYALGAQHKMAEDAIKVSGIDWTLLRCGGFATNTMAWAATVRGDRVVRAPYGQAAMALIDEQDIAAVAVRTLLDPGHASQTYYLTGPESLTQIQRAAHVDDRDERGRLLGRHDVGRAEGAVHGGLHHGSPSPSGYWNTSSSGTLNTREIWKAISREGE